MQAGNLASGRAVSLLHGLGLGGEDELDVAGRRQVSCAHKRDEQKEEWVSLGKIKAEEHNAFANGGVVRETERER